MRTARAAAINARCPACKAPIVGTNPIGRGNAASSSRACTIEAVSFMVAELSLGDP